MLTSNTSFNERELVSHSVFVELYFSIAPLIKVCRLTSVSSSKLIKVFINLELAELYFNILLFATDVITTSFNSFNVSVSS